MPKKKKEEPESEDSGEWEVVEEGEEDDDSGEWEYVYEEVDDDEDDEYDDDDDDYDEDIESGLLEEGEDDGDYEDEEDEPARPPPRAAKRPPVIRPTAHRPARQYPRAARPRFVPTARRKVTPSDFGRGSADGEIEWDGTPWEEREQQIRNGEYRPTARDSWAAQMLYKILKQGKKI